MCLCLTSSCRAHTPPSLHPSTVVALLRQLVGSARLHTSQALQSLAGTPCCSRAMQLTSFHPPGQHDHSNNRDSAHLCARRSAGPATYASSMPTNASSTSISVLNRIFSCKLPTFSRLRANSASLSIFIGENLDALQSGVR